MATTCKQIIEAAYARSTFNDPDKLATNAELVGVVDRRLKQLYSVVARENPLYFGKRSAATVASQRSGETVFSWARPSDAELIFRLEAGAPGTAGVLTAGKEIHIVPFEDQAAEMSPKVYEFGQRYYSPDGSGDPEPSATGDTVVFFYSKRHPDLDSSVATDHASNTLDGSWPEQFNDLVVLHVARYLATKDQRGEEVQVLMTEEASLHDVFMKHLAHENYGMKSRWGQRARLVSLRPRSFDEE